MNYMFLVAIIFIATFLKQSEGFTRPVPTLIMAAGYVCLSTVCPSPAHHSHWYRLCYLVRVGIVLVTMIAWVVQGKSWTPLSQVALIVCGVLVMTCSLLPVPTDRSERTSAFHQISTISAHPDTTSLRTFGVALE
jgi:small multidrug resistance pump